MKTKKAVKKAVKKVARGTKLAHVASKISAAREEVLQGRIRTLENGVKGLALSLGWMNVPPIDSLQKDINAKKVLHDAQLKLIKDLETERDTHTTRIRELEMLCDNTEIETNGYAADAANVRLVLAKVPAWIASVALDGSTAGAFSEEISKALAEDSKLKDLDAEWKAFKEWQAEKNEAPEIEAANIEEIPEAEVAEG